MRQGGQVWMAVITLALDLAKYQVSQDLLKLYKEELHSFL
jgi:hypothetical protein